MGWRRASHELKSPITATRSALGAHTAKRTPWHAVDRDDVGAERLGQLEMPPFVEQVQIELAQQRAEGIGILGLLHRCRAI